MKSIKSILFLLFTLFCSCSSLNESLDNTAKIQREAYLRVSIIPILASTYQFTYNIFPNSISEVDSFVSSKDFSCSKNINYKSNFLDSLYSSVDFLNTNDTLQNIKINLRPFVVDSFNVFGGNADVILHKVKKDSTFEFEIKTLTVRITEDQSIKANMEGKTNTSIIKCN